VTDLNRLYRAIPALHARDCEAEGFEWLIADDAENSVFAWLRKGGDGNPPVAVVTNFTPLPRDRYVLPLPRPGRWRERLNTDATAYGGSGRGNLGAITAGANASHGRPASAEISLPPLATVFFEYENS
jgi:1,4-alpha-glucan branching enzyme